MVNMVCVKLSETFRTKKVGHPPESRNNVGILIVIRHGNRSDRKFGHLFDIRSEPLPIVSGTAFLCSG